MTSNASRWPSTAAATSAAIVEVRRTRRPGRRGLAGSTTVSVQLTGADSAGDQRAKRRSVGHGRVPLL